MEGNKYDEGKPPVAKLLRQFPNAIRYLSLISEYGHNKYGTKDNDKEWDNWKHVSNRTERYDNAHSRHSLESLDHFDESGFLSAGHTAWNALAVLESILLDQEERLQQTLNSEEWNRLCQCGTDGRNCKCGIKI